MTTQATEQHSSERLFELLADDMVTGGVSTIFTIMGEDILRLIAAARQRGIACVIARHENQAVAMADGFSRATGQLGVAALTGGPGFTNAFTAINTAHRGRSSVVVIVGGAHAREDEPDRADLRGGFKHFAHAAVCEAAGIPFVKPFDAASVMSEWRSAVVRARGGRAVVYSVSADLLDTVAEACAASPDPCAESARPAPDVDAVARVAELLQEQWAVPRPVIIAGHGAIASEAGPVLRRLGELTGALLATTLRASGLFDGEPANLGICGTFATPTASDLIRRAGCVMAFGATLNPFTTYGGDLVAPGAPIIQVDDDPSSFGRFLAVESELSVLGDVRATAEALVAELERRGVQAVGYRRADILSAIAATLRHEPFSDESVDGRMDPRTLMLELDAVLPPNRVLSVDIGHSFTFPIAHLQRSGARSVLQPLDAGSIGLSLGCGIGAAIARPDRTVIAVMGDAAFMMSVGDLETAVRNQVPLIVVVMNDQALGAEVHWGDAMGVPHDLCMVPTPSLAAVADAMGAEGFTITCSEDVVSFARRLGRTIEGPLLLDCRINGDVRADWFGLILSMHRQPDDISHDAAELS